MIQAFLKLPFVVRALILWGGVLTGIFIAFWFSIAENGRNDQPLQLMGLITGHGMAWTCCVLAFLMPSPWSSHD
jgi:hypothetical protein